MFPLVDCWCSLSALVLPYVSADYNFFFQHPWVAMFSSMYSTHLLLFLYFATRFQDPFTASQVFCFLVQMVSFSSSVKCSCKCSPSQVQLQQHHMCSMYCHTLLRSKPVLRDMFRSAMPQVSHRANYSAHLQC